MIESYSYGTDRDRHFSTSFLHPHPMVEYAHGKMGNLSAADGSGGAGGSSGMGEPIMRQAPSLQGAVMGCI
jgi:hypothetical protein